MINANEIIARRDRLRSTRGVWESHWQEIADRVLPRQASFVTRREPGEKRTREIFDATAALALERFSAALESMLTPRTQRWHRLRASDPALNDLPEVRAWFDRAEAILFGARYSPHANYAAQQHEVYMSLGAFGTGVLFVAQDEARNGLLYRATHLADCYVAENFQGRIDTLYRDFEHTARQAMQRWGDANPEAIRRAAEKEPERKFRFIHAVQPRDDDARDASKVDGANKPFASVYLAEEGRTVVQESGFDEFPYMVSRYVTAPREVYGRSPAMTVLPDIKMLNEMNKTTIRQAQLAVEPPILVFDDGVLGRPDGFGLTPGYINYGGVNKDGRPLMQPFQSGARVDISLDMMEQRRRAINDAFLVTLFQILVDQPNMTATEAMIRAQEKGALLTPVMGRQQSEALGPMIERELGLLQRLGVLPPIPGALVEAAGEFDIEYDSPLSRAQRSEQVVGISRTFEVLAPLAATQPTVFGSADVAPIKAGNAILFLQRAARKLMEQAFSFEADGFRAADMTELAEHITAGGIVEMAYQKEPDSVVWVVRADGTLLGMTYRREQDVVGWHSHVLGGRSDAGGVQARVESVAVIPSPDGTRDELWLVVQRYIDGAVRRHIEYLERPLPDDGDQADAFYVDAGLTGAFDPPETAVTNLSHLEGETVQVLADGASHPDKTVSGGAITLDRLSSKVHVGLPYDGISEIQTLNLEAGSADGTAQGKTKRITHCTMRFHRSRGVKAGPDTDNLDPLPELMFRDPSTPMGDPDPLFTGDSRIPWPSGYDREARITLVPVGPFPCTLIGIYPQVLTQDR